MNKMFQILGKCNNKGEDMKSCGLTDGAVCSIVARVGAVTLVFVLAIAHAHTPVLAGEITAGVHCGK